MSKVYNRTEIDGDLAVGRKVVAGGELEVKGKGRSVIEGSLKVDGFIEAKYIKENEKGLFTSVDELNKIYPNPRPGWFALVLDTAIKGNGFLYAARGGKWELTDETSSPYDFIQDSINVFASKDELQAEKTERKEVEEDIKEELDKTLKYTNTDFSHLEDDVELECWDSAHKKHYVTSIYAATTSTAGVMSAEDKRVLDKVADDIEKKQTVVQVEWVNEGNVSNMNDFTEAGIYELKGERTRIDDNLPVLNTGGGHTFHARLEVLDSSITGDGKNDDKCITQVMSFNNRLGQGEVYIRTGKGASLDNLTWEKWSTLQRNVNVGQVYTLNNLIDNGIYSGVYVKNAAEVETFVMVVINNYAAASQTSMPKSISQFKYSVSLGGSFAKYETRVGTGVNDWGEWEILNKDEITSMITDAVDAATKAFNSRIDNLIDGAPETLDTLKEIADWIANDKTGTVALANAISANTAAITAERTRAMGQEGLLNNAIVGEKSRAEQSEQAINDKLDEEIERSVAADQDLLRSIDDEVRRAEQAEQAIKEKAVDADSLNFLTRANVVALNYMTIDEVGDEITIPAATTEKAGVMSAADKVKLNNSYKDINVSPNEIDVELDIEDNAENTHHVVIPAATTSAAGVMSAEDKVALDAVPSKIESAITEESKATDEKITTEIDKLKKGDTIAGQAMEIHSRNGKTVTDSFLARTTAGSVTIGDGVASLKSVGGNIIKNLLGVFKRVSTTVKYNVEFENDNVLISAKEEYVGDTAGSSHIGISTLNFISGHTYYISAKFYSEVDREVYICPAVNGYARTTKFAEIRAKEWAYASKVITVTGDNLTPHISIYPFGIESGYLITDGVLIFSDGINIIDLTEMFGVGNEPTQEECDRVFGTMDALPQGLTIAKPNVFTSTGFNQFNPDNVLEGKAIVDNAIVSGDKKIAVIPCLPCKVGVGENNGYCIHGEFGEDIKVYLTPLNPMEVDGELYMHELTKDATTDTYVPLIKGYLLVEVPTTANLCAHFLWSEDKCERDSYEPYYESKVELPTIPQMSEWGLAGIQSSGTLACDEIDFERGVYVKRIGSVDLGSLNWLKRTDVNSTGVVFNATNNKEYFLGTYVFTDTYTYSGVYETAATFNSLTASRDKVIGCNTKGNTIYIRDSAFNADALKGKLVYYLLKNPEKYPLPKVDNNYTSSDYGVEQFDSVVPCNANNLYYMRSLAGETRNFLDRMYNNTAKTDAKEVADYITNGIEGNKELATNAPNLALRALYVAAGAEYNDSGTDKTKTAPWGETVTHKAGHYYLNGLGDITEEEMATIYLAKPITSPNSTYLWAYSQFRTNLSQFLPEEPHNLRKFLTTNTKIRVVNNGREIVCNNVASMFGNCVSLHSVCPILDIGQITSIANTYYMFNNTPSLVRVKIKKLKYNFTFDSSPLLDKASVLYLIQNAAPTSAITITLHADAYARLAEDADIVAALAAQPLITLVSA